MKSKKYLFLTLFFMLFVANITTFAGSFGKNIRVRLTQSYTYLLNNKPILQGQPAIFYNNILYVPAEDFAKELGYTVEYDNSTAVITNAPVTPPSPKPSPTTTPPAQTASVTGTIVAIDFASNRIVIAPNNAPNNEANQITVFANDSTQITSAQDGRRLNFNDLDTNLRVSVTYQTISTKSIPPQTRNIAQSITILPASGPQPR